MKEHLRGRFVCNIRMPLPFCLRNEEVSDMQRPIQDEKPRETSLETWERSKQRHPLHYNDDSMETWRNVGDRAKSAKFWRPCWWPFWRLGEPQQGLHRRIEAFSCASSTVIHTQLCGVHTNRRDQNEYNPRYGSTKWTLELCHQYPGTVFVRGKLLGSEFSIRQVRIIRAQVPLSRKETERQNYLRRLVSTYMVPP
ncbi:hypothetical protein TNCV_2381611 [Trichonephila clavipes]|nr:hypothetical protein TNCV_2381611 [Trichonephila clavipes]